MRLRGVALLNLWFHQRDSSTSSGRPPSIVASPKQGHSISHRGSFSGRWNSRFWPSTPSQDNPIHYLLAGLAHARLGQYGEADARFTEAQRIYPAYELDIEPEREAAWIELFNEGIAAYTDGNVEATIEAWSGRE